MNKKFILMLLVIVASLLLAVFAIDSRLKTVYYSVENEKSDEHRRIVYITDLHSCSYGGAAMTDLIDAVDEQKPDMVLFGGDIFDSRRMPDDNAKIGRAHV